MERETAKHICKKGSILTPTFFLISGGLTLIAAGAAYAKKKRTTKFSAPCLIAGLTLTVLGIIYCLTMIFLLPFAKQLYHRMRGQQRLAETPTEERLSVYSEEILAADGDGIAFGPKRRHASKQLVSDVTNKSSRETETLASLTPRESQLLSPSYKKHSRSTKSGSLDGAELKDFILVARRASLTRNLEIKKADELSKTQLRG